MHSNEPPDIIRAVEATVIYQRMQAFLTVVDQGLEAGPRKGLTSAGRQLLAEALDPGADPDAQLELALRARFVRTLKGFFVRLKYAPSDPEGIWITSAFGSGGLGWSLWDVAAPSWTWSLERHEEATLTALYLSGRRPLRALAEDIERSVARSVRRHEREEVTTEEIDAFLDACVARWMDAGVCDLNAAGIGLTPLGRWFAGWRYPTDGQPPLVEAVSGGPSTSARTTTTTTGRHLYLVKG